MAPSPRPATTPKKITSCHLPELFDSRSGTRYSARGSTPRDPRIPLDVTSASELAARADTRPTTAAANNTDDVDGTARRTRLIEGAKHWRVRRIRDDARRTPDAARRDATRDGAPTTPARSCVAYVDATYVRQARFRRLYACPRVREIRKWDVDFIVDRVRSLFRMTRAWEFRWLSKTTAYFDRLKIEIVKDINE